MCCQASGSSAAHFGIEYGLRRDELDNITLLLKGSEAVRPTQQSLNIRRYEDLRRHVLWNEDLPWKGTVTLNDLALSMFQEEKD